MLKIIESSCEKYAWWFLFMIVCSVGIAFIQQPPDIGTGILMFLIMIIYPAAAAWVFLAIKNSLTGKVSTYSDKNFMIGYSVLFWIRGIILIVIYFQNSAQ